MAQQKRDDEGKYTHKKRGFWSKVGRFIIWVIVLAILIPGLWMMYEDYKTPPMSPEQYDAQKSTVEDDDGLTQDQRERLAKQAELAKKETVLMNQKEKLDADYKTKSAEMELRLQEIRKEKLGLVSAPKQ